MTGEALRVVEGCVASQLFVRVVAGDASKASVVYEMAAAVEDSVGLEAYVRSAALTRERHHRVEALVARAAELLRQLEGVQVRRVEDVRVFQILRARGGDVTLAGAVARLATDAGQGELRL